MFSCDICHKLFSRRDNFKRHLASHANIHQHQCSECGKVFARLDNYRRHLQNQHLPQTGHRVSTEGDEPAPKKQKISDSDVTNLYHVTKVKEVEVKKFNTKGTDYRVKFKDDLDIHNSSDILETLHNVFESLFDTLTTGAAPKDLVRIVITCSELDYPIQLPFITKDHLTAERFLARVEQVLQSSEQVSLDDSLEIKVTHVSMPSGGKIPKKRYVNLERFLKEKRCIIQIKNKDELCCARAIVTAKANIDQHKRWDSIRRGYSLQKVLAEELHHQAGLPLTVCGIDEIKKFQHVLFGYQIVVASKEHFNAIIFRGPAAEHQIFLYFHHGHYDVITSLPAFLNRSYCCPTCFKGYDHKEDHRCENTCRLCFSTDCVEGEWQHCLKCNLKFKSSQCFKNHLKKSERQGKSRCELFYRCSACSQFVNRRLHRGKEHVCGEKHCSVCKKFVPQDHRCYMQPAMCKEHETEHTTEFVSLNENEPTVGDGKPSKQIPTYIFFDFECMQETGIHVPNLCIAHKVCEQCQDQEHLSTCENCGERQKIFQGPNTKTQFCEWLFGEANAGATVICHNFKGYDSYFILQYLYDNAVVPKVILNGAKVMCIEVAINDMKFIDSFNFLPMALSKLPGTFGLKELAKGYFPHFYNTENNQDTVLSHLPDVKYYNPNGMKPAARQAFTEWYSEHQGDTFNLKLELIKYCQSDVDILRRCCLQFRSLFMSMTADDSTPGIDPFQQCITIASACNLVYRTKYLKSNTIGVIPPQGYPSNDRQSIKALQWLKWVSHQTGHSIQHAANSGEKHIGKYKADGFYIEDGVETVLEFHGCLHHGHTCRPMARHTKHPLSQLTMEELYQKTIEKRQFIISQGCRYIEKWECEFNAELAKNADMKDFVKSLDISSPLKPRDAFFGGRTNATKLFYEAGQGEKINYVDYTSLYPYVNKYKKYPLGHPVVITENFGDINEYEGLVKCKVLPPRGLYHPVIPYKASNRLMFPLCAKCSETMQQSSCRHTDEERALTGTWVTFELQKALKLGYRLLHIYEVWHFDEVSVYNPDTKEGGLFASYVNAFLKMKQESSDWPKWCQTDEKKHLYIKQYFDREGINLDWNHIETNPGLRALAKLMLNSFWGKFGQKSNMSKTCHIVDPAEYMKLMTNDEIEINSASFINEEMIEVNWQNKEEFIEPSGRTNAIIAAYTTAHARLELYELLERLDRRVLYYDTDSVIYASREGEWEPKVGDYLGELTNELDNGNHIIAFVSGGPKNYAYKLAKPDSNGYTAQCKVRGITLNCRNQALVNFETMFNMVKKIGPEKIEVVDPYKISRNKKTMNIETKEAKKDYRVVYTKRVPIDNYDTLPYGY